jgi:predicted negative regulator of RcsB-dependent stress response
MNLELKDIPAKLEPVIQKIRRDIVLIFIVTLAVIFGFLVFRISQLAQSEPSETAVEEKLQQVKRPKIDEKAVEKIQQLEDTNVQVRSLFKQARENPFQE